MLPLKETLLTLVATVASPLAFRSLAVEAAVTNSHADPVNFTGSSSQTDKEAVIAFSVIIGREGEEDHSAVAGISDGDCTKLSVDASIGKFVADNHIAAIGGDEEHHGINSVIGGESYAQNRSS